MHPRETEQSKVFPNEAFGYWKVTVERPLRLRVELDDKNVRQFTKLCAETKEEPLAHLVKKLAEHLGAGPHLNWNVFMDACEKRAEERGVKLTSARKKLLQGSLAAVDDTADRVVKKRHKPGKIEANPLYGLFEKNVNGKTVIVEYEPDTALRDTEQVPLLENCGIAAFIQREVLPYVGDAWVDESKTQVGYEISFTRHFYKPAPMRSLEEIRADIYALEQETDGLLEEIVGGKA